MYMYMYIHEILVGEEKKYRYHASFVCVRFSKVGGGGEGLGRNDWFSFLKKYRYLRMTPYYVVNTRQFTVITVSLYETMNSTEHPPFNWWCVGRSQNGVLDFVLLYVPSHST